MKQTAVEWLYNKFSTCTSDELVGNINNWFEQAKAMEKEQIMEAHSQGYRDGYIYNGNGSIDYYHETFKSE